MEASTDDQLLERSSELSVIDETLASAGRGEGRIVPTLRTGPTSRP